jgi:ABC-type transport system involved in multi-copper enzyme maturation permease subunit
MRMFSAELLALRKRAATYVVLGVLLVVMTLIYVVIGLSPLGDSEAASNALLRFPGAYSGIAQMVFGLGGLLAVAYSAAVAGADWNWGIPRLIISRGESRVVYVLAKAAAVAVVLAVGVVIAYAAGIALVYLAASMSGQQAGNPIGGQALTDLIESLALGYPVLLERAAIAFAVAILLRSQVAGIVIGIVLYIGEGILGSILLGLAIAERGLRQLEPFGPEWYQYLPFSIGDSVLTRIADTGTGAGGGGGGFEGLFLRPVPLEVAFGGVVLYLVAAMVVAVVSVWRSEITV